MQKLKIMATITIFPPKEVIMWPPNLPCRPLGTTVSKVYSGQGQKMIISIQKG